MELPIFKYKIQIREHHLDTFGHVNNATYLSLLEEARWEIIENGGYGLNKVKEMGVGPTILQINIKYKRELLNRDTITIVSEPQPQRGKIGIINQKIINQHGEICCEASLTIALFDLQQRKLVLPTKEWLKAIGLEL